MNNTLKNFVLSKELTSFSMSSLPQDLFAILHLDEEVVGYRLFDDLIYRQLGRRQRVEEEIEETPIEYLLEDCTSPSNDDEAKVTKSIQTFLEEFTCFPKLPVELRKMIWKLSIEPRTIVLTISSNKSAFAGYYTMEAKPHTPVIFHVSGESRELALSTYKFSHDDLKSIEGRYWEPVYPCLGSMYYSPEHDTFAGFLHTAQAHLLPLAILPLNDQFKKLAVGAETLEAIQLGRSDMYSSLRECKGLKEITLIVNQELLGLRDMELIEVAPEHINPVRMKNWTDIFAKANKCWNNVELKFARMVPRAQEI